jgi:hypothetical protein
MSRNKPDKPDTDKPQQPVPQPAPVPRPQDEPQPQDPGDPQGPGKKA